LLVAKKHPDTNVVAERIEIQYKYRDCLILSRCRIRSIPYIGPNTSPA
jgi:hypothetical protein